MAKSIKKPISYKQKTEADIQLKELQRQVDYDTKDYTVELIVTKFDRGDFFIPKYQRNYIWTDKNHL